MADVTLATTEQIQVAIVLPPGLVKKLDEFVRLGVGENRESLIWLALDQFIVTTGQRLAQKQRGAAARSVAEPGSPEWAAGFQQLEKIASATAPLTDDQMDQVVAESVAAVRREQASKNP